MNRRIWLIGSVFLLGVILFVWGMPMWNGLGGQTKLSAEAAESIVLEQYSGDIIKTTAEKDRYLVQLQLDKGLYTLEIDGQSGDIVSILRDGGEALFPDGSDGVEGPGDIGSGSGGGNSEVGFGSPDGSSDSNSPSHVPTPPSKTVYISEEEAKKIALSQVSGEVDDVDFYERNNQVYYLVEIEVEDDREEAVIQIHAITGEVMSITWDDFDDA